MFTRLSPGIPDGSTLKSCLMVERFVRGRGQELAPMSTAVVPEAPAQRVTAGAGARGTGAGTAQISRLQGIWVNSNSITAYNGLSSFTIPANQCTIVGSLSIDSGGGTVTVLYVGTLSNSGSVVANGGTGGTLEGVGGNGGNGGAGSVTGPTRISGA